MIKLNRSDYEKILAHAKNEAPVEACGLIAGEISGEDRIIKKVYIYIHGCKIVNSHRIKQSKFIY